MTVYALLEIVYAITLNHNETFVSDEAELNVEETEEA